MSSANYRAGFVARLAQLIRDRQGSERGAQAAFARRIEVSSGNLSDWLRLEGKPQTYPSLEAIARIYEEYNVDLPWLIAGKSNQRKTESAASMIDLEERLKRLETKMEEQAREREHCPR